MKAFEGPCFSGNTFNLMFFHPCIITMITLTNYFLSLPRTQPSLYKRENAHYNLSLLNNPINIHVESPE